MTDNPGQKYNVICLSNQIWNYPLWTNKKHVMYRLAKLGHNVIYVDPPINTGNLFWKQLKKGAWSIFRLLTGTFTDEGVLVYSPLKFIPGESSDEAFFSKFFSNHIKNLSKKNFNPSLKTILWVYHVELSALEKYLERLPHDILVYDCVDNYVAFPKYRTPEQKKKIIEQEIMLTKRAKIVFTTAPGLYEKLKQYNTNIFYTPNVGDFERFKYSRNNKDLVPEEIKNLPKPVIGFTGALDNYKFDAELTRILAQDHPNYSFVLIGPIALEDREGSLKEIGLSDIPNIHFLGTRNFTELPKYYAGFDAYIIPYRLNDYTVGGCFPVKFHEALSAGVPTVVTNLPAYLPFKDVCYISKNYAEFSINLRKALEEDSDTLISKRVEIAKQNSWEGKVETMLGHIEGINLQSIKS